MKLLYRLLIILFAMVASAATYFLYPPTAKVIQWPEGKKFAFTIVDDTDSSSVERLRPLYDVLISNSLRTTKTVWALEGKEQDFYVNTGVSLADPAYREFLRGLKEKGFEISLHGVRGGSSKRIDIETGLDKFKKEFGSYPELHINHYNNQDNLYWGAHRFVLTPLKWAHSHLMPNKFSGHDPESEYFWGDIAMKHIRYVRRYTFHEINLLNINPSIPYRLNSKPYVKLWFPGSDGGSIDQFDELLKKENIARLEQEGGVTFVYAHLGGGSFNQEDNSPEPRFTARIKDLAAHNGWFAPASEILDHLKSQPGWNGQLSYREQVRLDLMSLTRAYYGWRTRW